MNKVILIGNLANDPEPRTTNSGVNWCTFRVAVQRRYVNPQGVREADFFNVVCWRQTADFVCRWFTKGRRIVIEGSLQNRTYDAQDGSKRTVTDVVADNVEFGDSKSDGAARPRTDMPSPSAPPAPPAYQAPAAPAGSGAFTEIDDDELPF